MSGGAASNEAPQAPARHRASHRPDPRLRAAAMDLDDAVIDPPRCRVDTLADRALAAPAHADPPRRTAAADQLRAKPARQSGRRRWRGDAGADAGTARSLCV